MGRVDVDACAGRRIRPTILSPDAGKHKRVLTVLVEDGQLEIAFKRSALDWLPHFRMIRGSVEPSLDLNHSEKCRVALKAGDHHSR